MCETILLDIDNWDSFPKKMVSSADIYLASQGVIEIPTGYAYSVFHQVKVAVKFFLIFLSFSTFDFNWDLFLLCINPNIGHSPKKCLSTYVALST